MSLSIGNSQEAVGAQVRMVKLCCAYGGEFTPVLPLKTLGKCAYRYEIPLDEKWPQPMRIGWIREFCRRKNA